MSVSSKGDLIARLVSLGLGMPAFEAEGFGPPHQRTFRVSVEAGGRVLGVGEGRSKKEAERLASEEALRVLDGAGEPVPLRESNVQQPGEAGASWPIYAPVLAQAIEAAIEFAAEDDELEDVQREAARFYRGLLAELGHGVQEVDSGE